MMKFSSIALTLILTAGLLTACRAPAMDETSAPSTGATTPSTSATAPSTNATTPTASTPITIPAPTGTDDATEGTGGINTMDPSGSMVGENGRMPFGR